MVRRYAHFSQHHKQQAVEMLAENSASIITPPQEATATVTGSRPLTLQIVRP